MFHLERKLYNLEMDGNEVIKINYDSDYQSYPSFVVSNNGDSLQFYYLFGSKEMFMQKVKVGDKVCKAAGTFDFILYHKNGVIDTMFQKPRWELKFFLMPNKKVFKSHCP